MDSRLVSRFCKNPAPFAFKMVRERSAEAPGGFFLWLLLFLKIKMYLLCNGSHSSSEAARSAEISVGIKVCYG